MRWPHVEDHFFADIAQVSASLRIGFSHAPTGIRRFDFARCKSHVATLRLCWQGARAAQVQSRRGAREITGEAKKNSVPGVGAGKKQTRPAERRFRRANLT
jgi:hypothetical protein